MLRTLAARLLPSLLLALAPARAEDVAGAPDRVGESQVLAVPEASALQAQAPAPARVHPAEEAAPAFRRGGTAAPASAFREHASIAYFSLGALAVGGVFYGIHADLGRTGDGAVSGNGQRMGTALGAAGFTAAAAGAAYLYYALTSERASPAWSESVSGGVSADGGVSARLTVPLSALAD